MEVIDALEQARRQYGLPITIRVDQGSEFTSKEPIHGPMRTASRSTSAVPGSPRTMLTRKAFLMRSAASAWAATGSWI